MNRLSERLQTVCRMIQGSGMLADIGCDHAYVPIELVRRGQFTGAVAADVRPGPLRIAEQHIREQGLEDRITVRLSDGLEAFSPGEADTVVIAGMGGRLTGRLLLAHPEVTGRIKELVLEPQSDREYVRRTLLETDYAGTYFRIAEEEMVEEDGKYYPVIRAVPAPEKMPPLSREEYCFGPMLLQKRHPVLRGYLAHRARCQRRVLVQLELQMLAADRKGQKDGGRDRLAGRILELEEELRLISAAEKRYEPEHHSK